MTLWIKYKQMVDFINTNGEYIICMIPLVLLLAIVAIIVWVHMFGGDEKLSSGEYHIEHLEADIVRLTKLEDE